MTLGEVDEKITQIDDLIFKADTGQIKITWDQYVALKADSETLMKILAEGIASESNHTYEETYEAREKVRRLNLISAAMQRHVELNPDTANNIDPLIQAAFNGGPDGNTFDPEASQKFAESLNYLFENGPKPPAEPAKKSTVFQRLFRRAARG